MTFAELANLMNVTENDVRSFVACLSVWTAKGYSFEDAIAKHMEQMTQLVNRSVDLSQSAAGRKLVVSTFFPAA